MSVTESSFLLFNRVKAALLSNERQLPEFSAFISKIYPRRDLLEISDCYNSVRCVFSQCGLQNLKAVLMEICDHEMNILALVGKKVKIAEASLEEDNSEIVLRVSSFCLEYDMHWDAQVPPNLNPLAENEVLIALQQFSHF